MVNRFITNFNDSSDTDLANVEEGNIRTKFYAYYNGYRVEIINANEAAAGTFNVTIYGTNKEESVDDIFGISKLVTSTLGSSMADSDVQAIKSNKTNYKLGNDLTVNYYPIVSLSYGDTEARIEIVSTNYK